MKKSDVVKKKRIELGISQKDFADALGMGKEGEKIFRLWEKGEAEPSKEQLKAITEFAISRPLQGIHEEEFTFIDLFAGIGGIRIPFQELGGKCVFTSEWDKFAQKTYRINFGEEPQGDITQILSEEIPDFDILLGGFPCQPFSQAGLHKGIEDTRGTLFFHVARIIEDKRPKAFLLENVKQLVGHDRGRTFETVLETLKGLNYSVSAQVLRAGDFGVPQNRQRIYIVGFNREYFDINDDFEFSFPKPPCTKTRLGDILEECVDSKYTISDRLWEGHRQRKLANQAAGKGFGYSVFNSESDYTNTLSARYYKDGSEILIDQGEGHNPRKLTPRECARLQGFPEEFIIPVSDTQAYKQFGNSVAVPVIRAIANQMIETMNNLTRVGTIIPDGAVQNAYVVDKELDEEIFTKVIKTPDQPKILKISMPKEAKETKVSATIEKTICVLVVEKEGKYEPIVVPNDWSNVSRHASDFVIASGSDATEIYGKYGISISKLQKKGSSTQVIRISLDDYNRLVIDLEEFVERLIHEVEIAIDVVIEEKNLQYSEEEKNKCFSRAIMKIFRENPVMENKTLISLAV